MFHRFDVPKVSADFHARPSFVTILPSFETGTLEASIKPRLFKREKLAGNLFKSVAINYRHVRGLSLRCSFSYTDVFIIAAVAPALYSRSRLEAVDLGISGIKLSWKWRSLSLRFRPCFPSYGWMNRRVGFSSSNRCDCWKEIVDD